MGDESKQIMTHLKDRELAERWGIDAEAVREMVRTRHVPYVWVGKGDKPNLDRISWRYVRFRISSIEKWESEQERTMGEQKPPEPVLAGGNTEGVELIGGKRPRVSAASRPVPR